MQTTSALASERPNFRLSEWGVDLLMHTSRHVAPDGSAFVASTCLLSSITRSFTAIKGRLGVNTTKNDNVHRDVARCTLSLRGTRLCYMTNCLAAAAGRYPADAAQAMDSSHQTMKDINCWSELASTAWTMLADRDHHQADYRQMDPLARRRRWQQPAPGRH